MASQMTEGGENESQVEVRCTGMLPGDLFGYMDWDDPSYGYWSESDPRELSYARYRGKYEELYEKNEFDDGDIPKLFNAFISEDNEDFRQYVVICVSRLKPTHEGFSALVSQSQSGDSTARALAVRALGLFSTAESLKKLLAALNSDEAIVVRSAAGALAHHPCPEVETALLKKLHFEDEEIVRRVLAALGRVGAEATERELLKLVENPEFYQRYEYDLLAALSANAGPLTLEALPRLRASGILDDWTLGLYFEDAFDETQLDWGPEERRFSLGRLFAFLVSAAGAVIMVALCNTVLWMISVPVAVPLLLLLDNTERWAEPSLLFKGGVLLTASGCALIGFLLATPFARLALRVWPVDPFGGWTVRYWVILAFGVLCLIPVIAFFSLTFVGLFNWSVRSAIEGLREPMLQQAVVRLGWSSIILGIFYIFYWAHMRAAHNIRRPFAIFLRRFSGFADRSLVVNVIKSMPKGVPLAFVASRGDQARNWDPFVWAFGGLRLLNPLNNLPIQIRTADKDWTKTVKKLLQNAKCVIIDLSDKSPGVELERQLIDECVSQDRVVALADARRMVDESSDQLLRSAIRYLPSFLNSAVQCLVKVGLVLTIWWVNEGVWGWLVLLVLPFLLVPSVSRAERKEIREAVRTAVHR